MESETKSKRPLGITIIIIWFVLEGIFYFYTNSLGSGFGHQDITHLFKGSLKENSLVAYGFGFAIFHFVVVWGFLERKHWMRPTTIIVLLITTGVSWYLAYLRYATLFDTVLSTSILVIVTIYLMKSNVKEYFGQTSSSYYSSPV